MKSKKQNLSKLALAALLAAASTTAAAEAAEMFDTKPGVLLAAKCGAAKCGAFSLREEVADNSSDMNNPYNPKYNTYRMEKGEKPKDGSQNNDSNGGNFKSILLMFENHKLIFVIKIHLTESK